MAKLYFSYSTMNAGKSTILLQASYNYREQGMATLLYTSAHYASEGGKVTSRIGLESDARLFDDDTDLFADIKAQSETITIACVFVDESQFLKERQVWQLARVADELKLPVMCFGLRTDFQGQLFEGSAALLAIADDMREIRTICHCGRKATMVVRQNASGETLLTGAQVSVEKAVYVSLCRRHWCAEMEKAKQSAAA